jgi:hypothetical protein
MDHQQPGIAFDGRAAKAIRRKKQPSNMRSSQKSVSIDSGCSKAFSSRLKDFNKTKNDGGSWRPDAAGTKQF